MTELLATEIYNFILSGKLVKVIEKKHRENRVSDIEYLKSALDNKLKGEYSNKYKSMLRFTFNKFSEEIRDENITNK